MAFTRAFLKSLTLNDDQIQAVIDAHLEVVNPLKEERNNLKAEAEKLPGLQKEIETLKGGEDYKAKYEKEHSDFEGYKKQIAQEAEAAKVKTAYRKLLEEEKISDKRLDAILKVTDFNGMKLDKDGNLEGADRLRENIGKEWAEFRVTTQQRKADVDTPPNPDNGGKPASRARELAERYYQDKYGVQSNAKGGQTA